MNCKLITLDLDRTTLCDANHISDANKRAIEDAIKDGIHVAIASGRVFTSLPDCMLEIPGIRYAVTSNGAEIYKLPEKAESGRERIKGAVCVRKLRLQPEVIDEILRVMDRYPVSVYPIAYEVFIDGQAYAPSYSIQDPARYGVSEKYIDYVMTTRIFKDDIRSFIQEHRHEIDALDLQIGDESLLAQVRDEIRQALPEIYMTSSVPHRLETAHPDAGKASGLQYLMNILGVKREATAAFGDADNDIDMIKAAGTGVAMKNASKGCKAAADAVTDSYDRDGVAKAFYKVLGVTNRKAVMEKYMRAAIREAKRAASIGEVPIGAVIVRDGEIIARGYNRRNTDHNTLSHAELNALRKASKKLGDWRLEGCTMYVTLEPCQMCAGALVQSRIDKVVIGCMSPKTGCAGSVMNLMQVPVFNHSVELEKGILEEECSRILTDFFENLRVSRKNDN